MTSNKSLCILCSNIDRIGSGVISVSLTIITEISFGDILTFLSIIISVVALLNVWANEKQIRNKEKADRVRTAASKTLAKIERWKELTLWYYQAIQPTFVETSELLAKDFDIIASRDFLWKRLFNARIDTAQRILEEEIEIAYVELYGYYPVIYDEFVSTLKMLKGEEEIAFNSLILATQKDVMSFEGRKDEYTTAMLGNDLRDTCRKHSESFQKKIEIILEPIHDLLVRLISESDIEILKRKHPKDVKT